MLETNVYGVAVPGRDGRAGMAAVVAKDNLNLTALRDHLARELPEYARPVFLRIREDNDVTTTFKQKKLDLVKQGFDPGGTSRSDLLQRSATQGLRPARPCALRRDQRRTDAAMTGGGRRSRAGRRARVLARRRAEQMVQEGRRLRRRDRAGAFCALWQAAAAGELAAWEATPEGALALVLVLDQFPRNMFRGNGRTYETDALARAVADRAIARGFDQQMPRGERQFFYLPFMHSEHLGDQERCVDLARAYGDDGFTKYAEQHADIVRRFGRFPHRNAILGRATTPEEQAFLDGGGFSG